MPQSLSAVYIHLVFSTKDRRPFLRDQPTRDALHSYLGGVSKQLDCPPILVGGVEDHVHLLARFGRIITQAEWVKELKRVSNLWLKERGRDYADFEWQGGYADFSVSQSNLEQDYPKVASHSRQPWAGGQNPFGIGLCAPACPSAAPTPVGSNRSGSSTSNCTAASQASPSSTTQRRSALAAPASAS